MNENREFQFGMTSAMIGSLFDDIKQRILSPLSYLREFDHYWMLEFDLPLVDKKDIEVTYDENIISIKANENFLEAVLKHNTKLNLENNNININFNIEIN